MSILFFLHNIMLFFEIKDWKKSKNMLQLLK